MTGFIVEVENRAGEMARITKGLADAGVNILVFGVAVGQRGALGFTTDYESSARAALSEIGARTREVPTIRIRMEDKPGQAAATAQRLAEAGINIEFWSPVITKEDNFTVAVGVSDVGTARQVLGSQVFETVSTPT